MVTKCYEKPNRKFPRYFKTCDAARIAREVVRDDPETTPEEVLACIAKGFGFTHISLSRQRLVESGVSLGKIPVKSTIAIILALIVKLAKNKRLRELLTPLIAALKKLLDYLDKLEKLFDIEQAEVDDVINPDKCRCKPTGDLTHGNKK